MKKVILASLLAITVHAYAESSATCDPSFTEESVQAAASGEGDYPTEGKYEFGEAGEYYFGVNGKKQKGYSVKETSNEIWAYTVTKWIDKSARVGKSYKFIYRDDNASCNDGWGRLEVLNVGGFAGGTLLEEMWCVCAVD